MASNQKVRHVFANTVIEYYVAESLMEAVAFCRQYGKEMDIDESELDIEGLHQVADEQILKIADEDDYPAITYRTCGKWAEISPKGFLCSTEW